MIYPNAAGIDISSKEHYVAVNPESTEKPIRAFGAFTEDLHALVVFLKECKVDTVAMEATGIYWVSLFLVLEDAGFDVVLVTAKHVKNVRGRKQMLAMLIGYVNYTVADYYLQVFNPISLLVN
ncbi:MAG: transposase [Saprospiraceae bacterium]|nr:transposase [Candidatus Vicinibacter affinis]